jgi:phage terminase small subunit
MFNRAAAEVEQSGFVVDGSAKGSRVVSPAFRVMVAMAEMMRSTGQRFGLTPGDRAGLRIDHDGPKNGVEGYIS